MKKWVKGWINLLCCATLMVGQPTRAAGKDTPATEAEAKEIRGLVEELVFQHERSGETPLISPGIREDDDAEYKQQFEKCQKAFDKLSTFKGKAFPILIEHLHDKRPSINFRNHSEEHAVGDACYWNLSLQLQDTPDNYSSYGYSRAGRDGQQHPKPYWKSSPFEEAGGLEKWLKSNAALSYPEMQVKCLNWLLEEEKKIGAPDAASYFENILPLEIRILERKLEISPDAELQKELERQRGVLKDKDASAVPAALLPGK